MHALRTAGGKGNTCSMTRLLQQRTSLRGKRILILFFWVVPFVSCVYAQENHPPVVKIISPVDGSKQPLNELIPYTISVADAEDGDSKYGEINEQEVFLQVKYVTDAAQLEKVSKEAMLPDPGGFVLLQKSVCVNCHAFDAPLIGPSLSEIAKRYPATKANEALLAKRIIDGSSGVWGGGVMPSHPELSVQEARDIVNWILSQADDPLSTYYPNAAGAMKLTVPKGFSSTGVFLLRATYSDHGAGEGPIRQGRDVITVKF